MFVHAHPDDEASGGGVLARYAAEGVETVVVTCTDGRCGDGPDGVKPGEPGHDPLSVAATRRTELANSCAILEVAHLETLGYADSGMMGWTTNSVPGSFWGTPVAEAARRLAALMRRYLPDVVVTYDENGYYGHPDHIQAHRITMEAVAATRIPAKVYWSTSPHSSIAAFGAVLRELGVDWEEARFDQHDGDPPFGLPDEQISTKIDVRPFARQKFDAMAAHSSQGENAELLRMGNERFTDLMGIEYFLRVYDRTGAELPETDLLAGLR
ncbi:PIG-L family deacetylase [Actinoplanes sp. NBRC 103695]|uniref:PIG-L family deacetylase n=1 Tax=Actinoplanes sp. NBRC 103695 TaxID=3032202 RepID=UPI002552FFB7|nr:PIG-L family deacetylase [Actinoplanes sp. NBRC 103695]